MAPLVVAGAHHQRSPADLAGLRQQVRALEGAAGAGCGVVRLGDPRLDRALPRGGLVRGGVHDAAPASAWDVPAALGFLLGCALRGLEGGPGGLVWVRRASAARETGVPYAPGLAALGLPGGRVAFVTPQRREDALWAAEEAAKAGGVVLVELDAKSLDLAVTRRLQLAAEAGASLVLAFSPHGAAASVARTRWRIAARPGPKPSWAPAGTEGLCGGLAWRAELLHAKAGRAGVFDLEWVHEARGFHLAAGLGGHADAETPLRLRCAGA